MDYEVKKEVWKVFQVILFLVVSIIFVLPYLVQLSTYLHEKAHQKMLNKYDVQNSYQLNLFSTIPNFFNPKAEALGVTRFSLTEYNALDKNKRTDINVAGIISDLRLLFLIGLYLAFMNVYLYYKVKIRGDLNFVWVLAINWLLFMWLLAVIQITIANITYPTGDVYSLVRMLKV